MYSYPASSSVSMPARVLLINTLACLIPQKVSLVPFPSQKQCKNLIDFIQSESFFSLFHFSHEAKSYLCVPANALQPHRIRNALSIIIFSEPLRSSQFISSPRAVTGRYHFLGYPIIHWLLSVVSNPFIKFYHI